MCSQSSQKTAVISDEEMEDDENIDEEVEEEEDVDTFDTTERQSMEDSENEAVLGLQKLRSDGTQKQIFLF